MKFNFSLRVKMLLLAVPLLILGLAFSLITGQAFSEETIKTQLQHFAAAHQSTLQFAPNIDRQWFPYPAITLHEVNLQAQNPSHTPVFQAKSIHIELSWRNLWGSQTIRNINIDHAQVHIQENSQNGQWQLGNITLDNSQNNWQIEQIQWQNSHIQLQQNQKQLQLQHSAGQFDQQSGLFAISGKADGFGLGQLAVEGQYQEGQINPLNLRASLTLTDGQRIDLDWQGQAQYQNRQLTGQSGKLNIKIPSLKLELEATPKDWHINSHEAYIAESPFVFTAEYGNLRHNGSGLLRRLHYQNGQWQLPFITADTLLNQGDDETALIFNSSFTRQADGTFQFEPLIIQSRLQVAHETAPILIGQWQGYLKGSSRNTWQAQLSGTLDTHAAQLTLDTQEHEGQTQIAAHFKANRLNLTPYLNGRAQGIPESWVQTWRQLIGHRQLTLGFNIDTLEAWGIQIKQLQSQILANADGAQSQQLQMSLYNGQAQGEVGLHNRPKNGWFVRLDFNNVHIKPLLQDLFRFNHLSGQGNAQIHLSAEGLTAQQWRDSLNGHSQIDLNEGAWQGINLANILQQKRQDKAQNQFAYDDNSQTRFSHFHATSHFSEGHGYTTDLRIDNPQLRLRGQGDFDIANGTLHYALLLERDRNAWLPLKIRGQIQRPIFALDYSRMTHDLDSGEAKQRALQDILNQQWSWIQKLPDKANERHAE